MALDDELIGDDGDDDIGVLSAAAALLPESLPPQAARLRERAAAAARPVARRVLFMAVAFRLSIECLWLSVMTSCICSSEPRPIRMGPDRVGSDPVIRR
jgi:hypothetical protein